MKAEWNDTPQCLKDNRQSAGVRQSQLYCPTRLYRRLPLLSAEAIDSQPAYAKKPLTQTRRRGVTQIMRQDKPYILPKSY